MSIYQKSVQLILTSLLVLTFPIIFSASTTYQVFAQTEIKITVVNSQLFPEKIAVPKGSTVTLFIQSLDQDYKIALPAFGIDKIVNQDATEKIEFSPDKPGKFRLTGSPVFGDPTTTASSELTITDLPPKAKPASNIKVSFDPESSGVAYVEVNGERIRIDTNTKSYSPVEAELVSTAPPSVSQTDSQPQMPVQNYDYQIINLPTPKRIAKHALNVHFTHRFSAPINDSGIDQLFGLDSFSASSLAFTYGVTDRLYLKAHRTPLCEFREFCKTIELGFGYHLLDETGNSPIALSTYASVEGNDNFTDNFTFNLQAMLARSLTKYVDLFFSPALHLNANGNSRFNPSPRNQPPEVAQAARNLSLGKHSGSFGFGINARIRPSTSLLFEFVPRVGFKTGQVIQTFDPVTFQFTGFENRSKPAIGFGIEKRLGRHAFALTFTNSQNTTTSRYNSSFSGLPLSKYVIGFNLFRRLL
ncbi:MAG: DUF5777 family beta-barrel protein [Acidobacteriota bacterium]